nr:ATP-binding protein [Pseudomonas insulae]
MAGGGSTEAPQQFNLLRWFSLVSLIVIASVAIGLGIISTRYVVTESVERDAMLTAQFIQAIATAEARHMAIPDVMSLGELLDPRTDGRHVNVTQDAINRARNEYLDHIAHLPDALLANIYAPDGTIIWSTNPALIGRRVQNDELEEAFKAKTRISASYHRADADRIEQKFLRPPQSLFIENYIPLLNAAGEAVTMVEIYKEPKDLIARIQRGYVVIWLATALGGGLIYFGLYWIVRRGSVLLDSQQKQLIANETFVALGEMSSAVAHSLRNPLAAIRSSAELAQELAAPPIQGNIGDIITQVDRMSKWVRELLQSSRPLTGDSESVDVVTVVQEVLQSFDQQLHQAGVTVEFDTQYAPRVVSQRMLLGQVLNSLFANALEAMPKGGRLAVEVEPDAGGDTLHMLIRDSGKGMSQQQKAMLFKPFFTTKQGGLGVGLVMVKRIMERFGGTINLTSREQEGTQVALSFVIEKGGRHGTQHIDR